MTDPAFLTTLYAAAANAGLLTEVSVLRPTGNVVVMAEFRAPDTDILDGLGVSRNFTLRYPTRQLSLAPGDEVLVAGDTYRVREVTQLGDGSECRATLTRLC